METALFERMHKPIESLLWAQGVNFWLLVVNLRHLSVNSGPLSVDFRPLEIDFWALVVDFGLWKSLLSANRF